MERGSWWWVRSDLGTRGQQHGTLEFLGERGLLVSFPRHPAPCFPFKKQDHNVAKDGKERPIVPSGAENVTTTDLAA